MCKSYMESQLACVAGETGADLKRRITRRMTEPVRTRLGWRGVLLLCAAVLIIAETPILVGGSEPVRRISASTIRAVLASPVPALAQAAQLPIPPPPPPLLEGEQTP
jgi:hypothetical protein